MSAECIVGVYPTLPAAEEVVHILDRAGLPAEQVSLVSREFSDQPELVEDLRLGDDSLRDAAIGAGVGGLFGLLVGLGIAAATDLGIVWIVGAQAAAACAVMGAFVGGLTGWGTHHWHIRRYEEAVRAGHPLIVAYGDPLQLARANRILKETGALEIHMQAKTQDDAPEIEEV